MDRFRFFRALASGRKYQNGVTNGNFANGITGWGGATLSIVGGRLRIDKTAYIVASQPFAVVNGHKYFVKLVDATTDMSDVYVYLGNYTRLDTNGYMVIHTANANSTYVSFGRSIYVDGSFLSIGKLVVIDITSLPTEQQTTAYCNANIFPNIIW